MREGMSERGVSKGGCFLERVSLQGVDHKRRGATDAGVLKKLVKSVLCSKKFQLIGSWIVTIC